MMLFVMLPDWVVEAITAITTIGDQQRDQPWIIAAYEPEVLEHYC
jgi:hypothetical protein